MPTTVNDVWRLFYDYNISTVVVLNDFPQTRVSIHNTSSCLGQEETEIIIYDKDMCPLSNLTLMLLVANLANTKDAKNLIKND